MAELSKIDQLKAMPVVGPNYVPTQAEIRAALVDEISKDMDAHPMGGPVPFLPVRVLSLVQNALGRANAGEFK